MAESTFNTCITLLWDPVRRLLKYLCKVEDNIKALNDAFKDLKLAQAEVEEKIRSGEARTDKHGPTKRANDWLNDVQAIEVEVSSLVEEKYKKRKILQCPGLCHCPHNCWSTYKISKQATELKIEVEKLNNKKKEKDMDVVTQKLVPAWKEMPATVPELLASSATVQRNTEKACDYIQDVGVGMVGIVGMGGVGKTTLLTSINNHLPAALGADRFDHVIWLVASQDLNINNLQKLIAEKVSFRLDFDSTTVEERGQSLCDFLREKKILLFLDDIWQPIELEKLGLRFPTTKDNDNSLLPNKVVFTTRSEKVCNEMMAYHRGVPIQKIKVDCLKQDEAWELFLNNVGVTAKSCIESNEKIREFAKEVAKKCGGLPLALKVIGRAMSSNETWAEWEVALDSLSAFDIEELWSKGDDPFPLLRRSYDFLNDETLKKCFLSCSLWPEDAIIKEEDLILRWLALNLITGNNFRLAYNNGVTIIQRLKRAALLEEVDNELFPSVKMHDIIRGMALWIASDCGTNKNKWIVHSGKQEEDVTNTNWGEAEVISVHSSELKNVTKEYCPSFPNLSALFLDDCEMGEAAADVLFQNMLALKCLYQRYSMMNEIPSSIGCLVGLRFLYLSSSYNLLLPIALSNLTELKYLYLNYRVGSIPHGLISTLMKLEFLWIEGYRGWGREGEASLKELGGLKAVGMEIYTKLMMDQVRANRQVSLWHISITDLAKETTLPLLEFIGERARTSLHYLSIHDCYDLEEIVVTDCCKEELCNLQQLHVYFLHRLQTITWEGEVKPGVLFRNVSVLEIDNCPCLMSVTWIGQLLYLERFKLWRCKNLVQVTGGVVEDEGGSGSRDAVDKIKEEEEETLIMLPPIFSHLKYLDLYDLPNLTSFSSQNIDLPSLEFLQIDRCPRLDLSPFSNKTIHSRGW